MPKLKSEETRCLFTKTPEKATINHTPAPLPLRKNHHVCRYIRYVYRHESLSSPSLPVCATVASLDQSPPDTSKSGSRIRTHETTIQSSRIRTHVGWQARGNRSRQMHQENSAQRLASAGQSIPSLDQSYALISPTRRRAEYVLEPCDQDSFRLAVFT